MSREILLVVGSTELDKGDEKLVEHLTQQLGYDAEVQKQSLDILQGLY